MKTRNAIIAVLAACGLLATAPDAFANGGPNGSGDPIIGNVVGSKIADRTVLGSDATACTATVERGLGHGRYGPAVVHHYSIAGLTSPSHCPDMGVVVTRRCDPTADLAVTWFNRPPEITSSVYLLRHFAVLSSSAGEAFPSYVGSQDFNGDGRGDLWASTDQSEHFTTLIRHGSGFVAGPAEFYSSQPLPPVVFGRLDRTPGTDLAAAFSSHRDQQGLPGSAGTGVLVVFGKTGGKVLLELDPSFQTSYTPALLDYNHDHHLDVKVTGGSLPPRIYLGDGAGHFTLAS